MTREIVAELMRGCFHRLASFYSTTPSTIRAIRKRQQSLMDFEDRQLLDESRNLQFSARTGTSEKKLRIPAFGLACEAIRRVHAMEPYDVQLMAGLYLGDSNIVEMATGEGKTLSLLAPLYARALPGKGVWLATANDYLAARDAEFGRPVFEMLGLSVAVVVDESTDEERRAAYQADVTYGTAVQFGFDFLKDRAKLRKQQGNESNQSPPVGRGTLHAILVDEADSLLIDEASTPLVIASAPPPISAEKLRVYSDAARFAPDAIEGTHYVYKTFSKKCELTSLGRRWLHKLVVDRQKDLTSASPVSVSAEATQSQAVSRGGSGLVGSRTTADDYLQDSQNQAGESGAPSNNEQRPKTLSMVDYVEYMERAILVQRDFLRDRNYIVDGGEISLVDEGTGRVSKDRQVGDGVHQAIQAKEGLAVTNPSGHQARVTVQNLFLAFEHVAGMTGTGRQAAAEFRSVYKLRLRPIPTHRPNRRQEFSSLAFPDSQTWLSAIADECQQMIEQGRSVLLGVRNVSTSEQIADWLEECGLKFELLNARHHANEAEIVGQAGQPGHITIATNMAGRGTDIKLAPDVKENGGLHVVLAGLHAVRRIDRQLIGRAGRQGDPGSFRKMICLADDLLDEAFTAQEVQRHRRVLGTDFSADKCIRLFETAQHIISRRRKTSRKALFHQEKENLKQLFRGGMDPLLDCPD